MLKFIHAADFHMDSAFASLPPRQAAARRRESRELPQRLANYANEHGIGLVLLAGDLFDSDSGYRETAEMLRDALTQMSAQVFIAPGNHDWYGDHSPYARLTWSENVHLFRKKTVESVALPEWGVTVHGAAFTAPEQTEGLLTGFTAPADGSRHLMVLHGEFGTEESAYNPIRREEVERSGLHYLALGHIHKRVEPFQVGRTWCTWSGCLEGRGFDELGEKGFYEGCLEDDGTVRMKFVPFAWHRYEICRVDVTGADPFQRICQTLPEQTAGDLYRILLTGETGEERIDLEALHQRLADRFYSLELQDHTRVAETLWARAEEDTLRGMFLRSMRGRWEKAETQEEREAVTQAVCFGLAALDRRDIG